MDTNKNNSKNKNKKRKYKVREMGINIDKNEFYEIVLSNSARPEESYNNKFKNY